MTASTWWWTFLLATETGFAVQICGHPVDPPGWYTQGKLCRKPWILVSGRRPCDPAVAVPAVLLVLEREGASDSVGTPVVWGFSQQKCCIFRTPSICRGLAGARVARSFTPR